MVQIHFVREKDFQIVFYWTNTQENSGPTPKELLKGGTFNFVSGFYLYPPYTFCLYFVCFHIILLLNTVGCLYIYLIISFEKYKLQLFSLKIGFMRKGSRWCSKKTLTSPSLMGTPKLQLLTVLQLPMRMT